VARVHAVLQDELKLDDGLADPNGVVLDPCCGTGTYLLEVLKCIAGTLKAKGGDALVAADVKKAATERVFGFEILPAPFVVSHLQLGLMLHDLGAPLSAKGDEPERVGVYLTNALTGWEPPEGAKKQLTIPELEAERDAAEHVKRDERILVVLGNPPYNAFAGVSPDEEQGLVEPYKEGLNTPPADGGWGIRKFNLDDLYVRFFRLAERRIAEMTGKGVVSFISNFSYLGDPSFVVMRQRFLAEFDRLWFDCMNGDSRETGKLTPDGKPDPSVFSTRYNREGIRVGTAVSVIVRKERRAKTPLVRFRHFWGVTKREDLLESLNRKRFNTAYEKAAPSPENRYSFRPEDVSDDYNAWPKLPDLAVAHFNGPVERRGNSLIAFDKGDLAVLRTYLDSSKSDAEIRALEPRFMNSSGEFHAEHTRNKLKGAVSFDPKKILPYPFKPLDVRFAYLDKAIQPLFSRPSPELLLHASVADNAFFITRDTADKVPEGPPFYFSQMVCDYDSISGHARHFPMMLAPVVKGRLKDHPEQITHHAEEPTANLSPAARQYLAALGVEDPDADADTAGLVWMHALAVGYSPAYPAENADGIRRDWPRVPLPDSREALDASAALGRQVAALLDTEADVPGVTAGDIEPFLRTVGALAKVGGGSLNPDAGDLAVTAGWGHAGKGGAVMPGKGRTNPRDYEPDERDALADAARRRGLSAKQALVLLGDGTSDVYLNDDAYWKNVPAGVWEYYIGGYQVIKKWLSYREKPLLGRGLRADEAREVTAMARRLTALVLLQPALDANYESVKQHAYAWPM